MESPRRLKPSCSPPALPWPRAEPCRLPRPCPRPLRMLAGLPRKQGQPWVQWGRWALQPTRPAPGATVFSFMAATGQAHSRCSITEHQPHSGPPATLPVRDSTPPVGLTVLHPSRWLSPMHRAGVSPLSAIVPDTAPAQLGVGVQPLALRHPQRSPLTKRSPALGCSCLPTPRQRAEGSPLARRTIKPPHMQSTG